MATVLTKGYVNVPFEFNNSDGTTSKFDIRVGVVKDDYLPPDPTEWDVAHLRQYANVSFGISGGIQWATGGTVQPNPYHGAVEESIVEVENLAPGCTTFGGNGTQFNQSVGRFQSGLLSLYTDANIKGDSSRSTFNAGHIPTYTEADMKANTWGAYVADSNQKVGFGAIQYVYSNYTSGSLITFNRDSALTVMTGGLVGSDSFSVLIMPKESWQESMEYLREGYPTADDWRIATQVILAVGMTCTTSGTNIGYGEHGTIYWNDNAAKSTLSSILYSTGLDFNDFNENDESENEDPYDVNQMSGPSGGDGARENPTDHPNIPPLPTSTAIDTGFIRAYLVNALELRSIASKMWSQDFIDSLLKIFDNPISAVLALYQYPAEYAPEVGGTTNVKIGNYDTEVNGKPLTSGVRELTVGRFNLKEYYGSFFDYDSNTELILYIPTVGERVLDTNYVMAKEIAVKLRVDYVSGATLAYVLADGDLIHTFPGACAYQIPFTQSTAAGLINSAISILTSTVSGVASGGYAGGVMGATSGIVGSMTRPQREVSISGSTGGSTALLNNQHAILYIKRPSVVVPKNQIKYSGYPSYIEGKISSFKGYTKFRDVKLNTWRHSGDETQAPTEREIDEIISLLKEGVYVTGKGVI